MITAKEAREKAIKIFEANLESEKIYISDRIERMIPSAAKAGCMWYKEEITFWHPTVLEYIKEKLISYGYSLREEEFGKNEKTKYLVISWEKEHGK
jgi:hypothetical protein